MHITIKDVLQLTDGAFLATSTQAAKILGFPTTTAFSAASRRGQVRLPFEARGRAKLWPVQGIVDYLNSISFSGEEEQLENDAAARGLAAQGGAIRTAEAEHTDKPWIKKYALKK